jgi:hypothetical protein
VSWTPGVVARGDRRVLTNKGHGLVPPPRGEKPRAIRVESATDSGISAAVGKIPGPCSLRDAKKASKSEKDARRGLCPKPTKGVKQ